MVTQMRSRVHRVCAAFRARRVAHRLLEPGTQFVGEFLDAIERHHGNALLLEQPRDELVARIFARGLDLGDGGELRIRGARADALGGVGQDFGLRRVAAQRDSMNIAARSVVAVAVIETQRDRPAA